MLMVLVLSLLLSAQQTTANSDITYDDLLELVDLLSVEKRYSKEEMGDYIKECSQEPIELGLVIDSSRSIHPTDFEKGKRFLSDFLSTYDIGPGRKQVRVSAVTFGEGIYLQDSFNLNTYKTKDEVLKHVTDMKFRMGGRTDTWAAIRHMRTVQMSNTRSWAPKIAIVLTDGNSQRTSATKMEADEAKNDNITVFAVGVGRSVKESELLNIAGGNPEQVIRAESYSDLNDDIRDKLAFKTCVLKPRPTTPPPATLPCSEEFPSDINFVFSPATLGVDATSWVTQFISHTISNEELESGFQVQCMASSPWQAPHYIDRTLHGRVISDQCLKACAKSPCASEVLKCVRYGVVSGDCPDDEGFSLGELTDVYSIRRRLEKYDRNNLPTLVRRTTEKAFSNSRPQAGKVAVIFLGKAKVDHSVLNKAIEELQASGVQVFVSRTDPGVYNSLPKGVHLLDYGSSISQSSELVAHICRLTQGW